MAFIQFLLFLLIVVPLVIFIWSLQRVLNAIEPESRRMHPALVWLLLIPLLNSVWIFIVVSVVSTSIKKECARLNIPIQSSYPTLALGLSMVILTMFGTVLVQLRSFPIIGPVVLLTGFVCWIIYWIKVTNYKKLIIKNENNFLLDIEKEIPSNSL